MQDGSVYTCHTCRVCSKAFIDFDNILLNNISPAYRACPECVKKGNKYEDNKVQKVKDLKIDNFYTYVQENTSSELRQYEYFILSKGLDILNKDSKIRPSNAFKQSLEILNYYIEDNDFSFKDFEFNRI